MAETRASRVEVVGITFVVLISISVVRGPAAGERFNPNSLPGR
jgi:hypothetical protein